MAQKSIKLNFCYNVLLQISKVVFPLITAPYVARVLEPDGIGLFNFSNTYANYFALFAALGIPMYGVREISKLRDNESLKELFLSEIVSLSLLTTIFCSVLYFLTVLLIPQISNNYIVFIIAALSLYITPFKIDWYYQGIEEFGYITLRSLVVKSISVLCLFLFVNHKSDLIIYIAINSLSLVVNEVWNFVKLSKSGIRPHFTLHFKHHVKPLLILFSSSIAMSIYTILDTLMLGFMRDYSQVGFYNCALQLSRTLLPIVTSLAAVAMPRLSYYHDKRDDKAIIELINKSMAFVTFLCFPIFVGLCTISPVLVPSFFGELYTPAILSVQIISGLIVAIGLSNLLGIQVLVGLGYDKLFLYAICFGTIVNFICNIVTIPHFGASGAAFSSLFAEFLILFSMIVIVSKKTFIRLNVNLEILFNFISSLSFIPLFMFLKTFLCGWYLIISFVLFGTLLYFILGFLTKNSVERLLINVLLSKLK